MFQKKIQKLPEQTIELTLLQEFLLFTLKTTILVNNFETWKLRVLRSKYIKNLYQILKNLWF